MLATPSGKEEADAGVELRGAVEELVTEGGVGG